MSYVISDRYEPQILEIALAQHISPDEALDRVIEAGLERFVHVPTNPVDIEATTARSYASFFGIAKGRPGAHGSREEVDRYIDELRNEW